MDNERVGKAMKILASVGIREVIVCFNGEGDDGQIEDVTFKGVTEDLSKIPMPDTEDASSWAPINGYRMEAEGRNIQHIPIYGSPPGDIEEFIHNFTYEVLEATGVDWVNNDGGFGEIRFFPFDGLVELDMNQRVMDTVRSCFQWGGDDG